MERQWWKAVNRDGLSSTREEFFRVVGLCFRSADPVPTNIGQCTNRQEQKSWIFACERVSILLDRVYLSNRGLLNGQTGLHGRSLPSFLLSVSLLSSFSSTEKTFYQPCLLSRVEIIVNRPLPVARISTRASGYLRAPRIPSNVWYLNAFSN